MKRSSSEVHEINPSLHRNTPLLQLLGCYIQCLSRIPVIRRSTHLLPTEQVIIHLFSNSGSIYVCHSIHRSDHASEARELERRGQMDRLVRRVRITSGTMAGRETRKLRIWKTGFDYIK